MNCYATLPAGHCDVLPIPVSKVLAGQVKSAGKADRKGQARRRCQVSPCFQASTSPYVLMRILVEFVRSCRRRDDKWIVAMNKWQDLTDMEVNKGKTSAPRVYPDRPLEC